MGFLSHAARQIDQADRRLLKGETIPEHEKVFSIFEPHTRRISKGKAGCPVEPGVPVRIPEDRDGFVLYHEIMWDGGDVEFAASMVEGARRGSRSPRGELRPRLPQPRGTGPTSTICSTTACCRRCAASARQEREQGDAFAEMRRQRPAVKPAINSLGHRGLDRVLAHGVGGFPRTVALSVVALNVHRMAVHETGGTPAMRLTAIPQHPNVPGSTRCGNGDPCAGAADGWRITSRRRDPATRARLRRSRTA